MHFGLGFETVRAYKIDHCAIPLEQRRCANYQLQFQLGMSLYRPHYRFYRTVVRARTYDNADALHPSTLRLRFGMSWLLLFQILWKQLLILYQGARQALANDIGEIAGRNA